MKNCITIEKVSNGYVVLVNDYTFDRKKASYICANESEVRDRVKAIVDEFYPVMGSND